MTAPSSTCSRTTAVVVRAVASCSVTRSCRHSVHPEAAIPQTSSNTPAARGRVNDGSRCGAGGCRRRAGGASPEPDPRSRATATVPATSISGRRPRQPRSASSNRSLIGHTTAHATAAPTADHRCTNDIAATAASRPTANAVTGSGLHGAATVHGACGMVNTVSRRIAAAVPATRRSARGSGRTMRSCTNTGTASHAPNRDGGGRQSLGDAPAICRAPGRDTAGHLLRRRAACSTSRSSGGPGSPRRRR
jgi:hypothetical protein